MNIYNWATRQQGYWVATKFFLKNNAGKKARLQYGYWFTSQSGDQNENDIKMADVGKVTGGTQSGDWKRKPQ